MYLFSYFKTEKEALFYAISEDGYKFKPYSEEAILECHVGNKSVRDPFIFQDQGGLYHLLFTDSWASTKIVHATSWDLIHWSDQELIDVMGSVENTRNAWAPECIYDHKTKVYVIFWSSTVGKKENGHRIWAVKTPDFKSFSDPFILFDPGYNVIDANIIYHNDEYLMTFKDERGENKKGTDYKRLRTAKSHSALGPFNSISDMFLSELVEGPTVYQVEDKLLMLYDYFSEPFYGGAELNNSWEEFTKFDIPKDARHGSVIKIKDILKQV
ncbi:hypothetical protein EZV73_05405 [Acidaminobacter sp. JC074]|uniref:glycoside hydrolase family 43 protein n=1 Tax=Acidaminobacter sp. JC074 TaxID=2530199 RepID=UPI001F10E5F6|nr:glycoside hydrolase family 43 protein [Acidaminobacter sp. JC074]MCH4886993.1 hypothetical protein [Acidaminobacter sp. JC074]